MGGLAALPLTKSTWHEVTRNVPSPTSQRLIDGEVTVHALAAVVLGDVRLQAL